jgi:hypothetical protein
MTTTPDEPIENPPLPERDPDIDPEPAPSPGIEPGMPDVDPGGEPTAPDVRPDPGPIEPSPGGPLDSPQSGLSDAVARGMTEDSEPAASRVDPDSGGSDDADRAADYAEPGGLDDRQQDGTYEASKERGSGHNA